MITLDEYIYREYRNKKTDFARANDVSPQQVNQWINQGYMVHDGKLVAVKREIV